MDTSIHIGYKYNVWPIDKTLTGNTIQGQSGSGSNRKEWVTQDSPEF